MLFEFRAVYADGHVALISDTTPTGARARARAAYPESPLARMVDGWNSVRWDADREPRQQRRGWTKRATLTHAAATSDWAWCGVRLATVTTVRPGGAFNPDEPGVCAKCARDVRR